MSACNTQKCCCTGSSCYQRWTADWHCSDGEGGGLFFDDPVAGAKACWPDATAPSTTWQRIAATETGCTYEIYVLMGSACTVDANCTALPDTDPPDPYVMIPDGATGPLDCCCPCECCNLGGVSITATVDATAMIPTPPATGEPGGWHTIPIGHPGDWHLYAGNAAWVAHPETIFAGSVVLPWLVNAWLPGYNCDHQPTTQPANQPVGRGPIPPFVGCGGAVQNFDYSVTIGCLSGNAWLVTVEGDQEDDWFETGPVYFYRGTVEATLTCVNGKPVGTAIVPMKWACTDNQFDPASPALEDCGTLTVVFS